MEFLKSFPDVKKRWDRFWEGKPQELRPVYALRLPKKGVKETQIPEGGELIKGDIKDIGDRIEKWAETHEFFGDLVPHFRVQYGPDHFAALLGTELELVNGNAATSWPIHFVEDWDKTEIHLHTEGFWWNRTIECIRELRKRFDDRLVIAPPNLQGGLDCLCAMRGAEMLSVDLMECPEAVARALRKVDRCFIEAWRILSKEADIDKYGTVTRHWMYSSGNLAVPQCDFSCMISADMFRKFGMPSLICESEVLEQAVYHLDGPDAIRHLEDICTVKKISVIQWQPGAGEAATTDWTDLHVKIDRLGKGQIVDGPAEKVLKIAERINNPRVFCLVRVETRDEALRFEEELVKIHTKEKK
ncbi:MAG TPA: hypothetical protein DCZ94_22245 [Lentisphaeria bacterium]|nr:MAG: hypothetical protein A2X48_13485 [Lentisphaerae bacterium GWF2_49_21]HBC89669.1 hypothetical protein [Lentisphaeria bacterium]